MSALLEGHATRIRDDASRMIGPEKAKFGMKPETLGAPFIIVQNQNL